MMCQAEKYIYVLVTNESLEPYEIYQDDTLSVNTAAVPQDGTLVVMRRADGVIIEPFRGQSDIIGVVEVVTSSRDLYMDGLLTVQNCTVKKS